MSRLARIALSVFIMILILPSPSFADGDGAITIHGVEGRGKDEQTALNNAFRNAIRKAIGSYVVSSATTDGETIDKKVFDNCDAVVSKYEIVEREEQDGKFTIVIDAVIVRNEMMKYIQKTASTEVGEGELANLLAKRNAVNNAVKSLELIFMNWRENVYRAEKYGNLSVADEDDASGDMVQVSIPFILTFNWQAYNVFLTKVRNVLSRIAINKTSGVWNSTWEDGHRDNLSERLDAFYIKAGLAHKDRYGNVERENSNNYGGVMLFSHGEDGLVHYELFIVPQQIKKALETLLDAKAEIRLSLTGKGGGTIASRSIAGEIRSFGWHYFYIHDDDMGWEEPSGSQEIAILSDKIMTEFRDNHGSCNDEWTEKRLFRATIPVPLEAAARVSGCSISVQPKGEDQIDDHGFMAVPIQFLGRITSESINEAEWRRIDAKPGIAVPSAGAPPQKSKGGAPTPQTPQKVASVFHVLTISEKDKELKSKIKELSGLPPDVASASKWFKLYGEAESKELKQEMLKVAGAALVYAKKGDVYQAKIRPLIEGVSAFEETFFAACPSCKGAKSSTGQCAACAGSGVCKYANCRGGRHLVQRIKGSYWEDCHGCNGSGRCQKCDGTGKTQSKCQRCQGRGRIISSDSVGEAYRRSVARIEEVFR